MQYRAIVRNCIFDLIFIRPPITETGPSCSVFCHFIGHFVAFQNMGECIDRKAHRIRHMHEHVNLILAVAVAGYKPLASKDLSQCFKL